MNAVEMSRYITEIFAGVDVVEKDDNSYFFYNPDPTIAPDHMFPWLTLMTNDLNDDFSNLDRPSVYRLNIGVSKATVRSLFGTPNADGNGDEESTTLAYDYTAFDHLMPHPVYGKMHWVCVLNPSDATFETQVRPLLDEAYTAAVNKFNKRH